MARLRTGTPFLTGEQAFIDLVSGPKVGLKVLQRELADGMVLFSREQGPNSKLEKACIEFVAC
jgi:hypothetical protein